MIDIDQVRADYLKQCGPCDFGLVEFGCNCPTGDARWAIQQLCDELEAARKKIADLLT